MARMEKQREKAAQRLQRKQQRQTLPSEDSLEVLDGPIPYDADEDGEDTGEDTPVAG
jgi:hypothetical protein